MDIDRSIAFKLIDSTYIISEVNLRHGDGIKKMRLKRIAIDMMSER